MSAEFDSVVRIKDNRLYILFLFYFSFLFSYFEFKIRVSMTLHMIVTNCHTSVTCPIT